MFKDCLVNRKLLVEAYDNDDGIINENNLEGIIKRASSTSLTSPRIYRLWPGGDRWGCHGCNIRGDRFDLEAHDCREAKKK